MLNNFQEKVINNLASDFQKECLFHIIVVDSFTLNRSLDLCKICSTKVFNLVSYAMPRVGVMHVVHCNKPKKTSFDVITPQRQSFMPPGGMMQSLLEDASQNNSPGMFLFLFWTYYNTHFSLRNGGIRIQKVDCGEKSHEKVARKERRT